MNPSSSESLALPNEVNTLSLDSLAKGEQARILTISSIPLSLALMKMGISQGSVVQLTEIAPLGDPIAFQANGTKISLRKKDASSVWIAKM